MKTEAENENRNEYEALVDLLLDKYRKNKAGSLTEIYADNPKYVGKIKAMGRKSKDLFGTTLAQYLKQVGVIGKNPKADIIEEEELEAEERRAAFEEERRAEEEFRRRAEEERRLEEERKVREEENRKAEEERKRIAEEERRAEERRRREEERKAEAEKKRREEEERMYELEHSAWVRQCNKRQNEKEKEYKRRLKERREELEYELECKRDKEIKAVMEEMIKYMRQLVDAEWTLESLGLFDFKGKKAQNASIAMAEAKIAETKKEIRTIRETYKNEIPSIDIQMKTEEVKIRKSIEKDYELPEEPKKPEFLS
ncbi:MAG: hypothetical protein IKW90_14135 [Lachnospiraceae bacterium]|nr:hypothetical protein [Lachnospiraceae bacterium]